MVVAGPIEFSPAEIAAIFAVLTVLAVVVTAPGWAVLAFVMGRRATGSRGGRWAARVGGALLGAVVCAAVGGVLLALVGYGSNAVALGALASWVVCWALAWLLWPRGAPASYDG